MPKVNQPYMSPFNKYKQVLPKQPIAPTPQLYTGQHAGIIAPKPLTEPINNYQELGKQIAKS